jgi:RNA polymerase sigma-70 factor (ECF subfamily)
MDHEALKAQFLSAYDAYGNAIYRFCVLKVSSAELAQDLTQEVFMRYWQSLRKGEDLKNERAYLYTLARHLIIDWYRKKKEASLDALTDAGLEFKDETAKSIVSESEVREILAVIETLDEHDRETLLLRFVEGFSPKEIGEVLGESANVISVRIHRALKKVQELIHADQSHADE